jgi:hypothetical protein
LISLTLKELKKVWSKLEENHREFENLSLQDEGRQQADLWLLGTEENIEQLEGFERCTPGQTPPPT